MDIDNLRLRENIFVRLPRDLNVGVWRYLDLWKLVSLLDERALHFARAIDLGDDWEGAVSERTLQERPARAAELGALLRARGMPWTDEQAQVPFAMGEQLRHRVMINCWHMGDVESAAMWGLYCPGGDGVAIRTTAVRLIEALPEQYEDSAINVSEVTYVDYGSLTIPEGNVYAPFTYKRESFGYERELRAFFLVSDPAPPVVAVPLDLAYIESVYVAPKAPDWRRSAVESLLRRYRLDVPVHKSGLDDPALH